MAIHWTLILGYVLFIVGAILIIIGFARLVWWGATYERRRRPVGIEYSPKFHAYYKDPWLRAPSMASIISRHEGSNGDALKVDTDVIYAVPADSDPRRVYLHPSPPTDHEMSQTESQIYANGSGSSRSNVDGSGSSGGQPLFSNVYSVLDNMSSSHRLRNAADAIDEGNDGVPALPKRGYEADRRSLTEADRFHFISSTYVDPPVDYSPERVVLNRTSISTTADVNSTSTRSSNSKTNATSSSRERSDSRSYFDTSDGSGPRELSGSDLIHSAVFRNSTGDEVSGMSRSTTSGSVKSMKSLYQYMYTDEPCALDREIEYSFTSSAL